ncbi:EAL domain-containing protein [Shewanella surugensis]|uniref:EAL domain-containing protein n=1 Tax=Shewanella surugensis TaxID=212020 RepID=A0ABT0LDH7_9GAMM|nr:EAL domain-containing protein [Shewanella surugensis]MCL1125761.1 EAL domain-containing protein [Shewanella surugensis]
MSLLSPLKAADLVQRVFSDRDGLSNTTVRDISFDVHGFTWLATEEGLYRVSNTKVRRIDKRNVGLNLDRNIFYLVEPLNEQYVLVSTARQVYLYDVIKDHFIRFGSKALFPEYQADGIVDFIKNPDGSYLFLTYDGELLQFSYHDLSLELLSYLPFHPDIPWRYMTDMGDHIVVATEHSLQVRSKSGAREAQVGWDEALGTIKQLFTDSSGQVWMATSHGLYQFDSQSFRVKPITQLPSYIAKMTEDNQGFFWLATRVGLLKWHPDNINVKTFRGELKEATDLDYIYAINIDANGLIWIGGSGDGVAILAEPPDFLLDVVSSAAPYQLPNELVWSIFSDEKALWLGTDGGLIRVDKKHRSSTSVMPKGLKISNSIYQIHDFVDEQLLLSTTNGLFVVNKEIGQAKGNHWYGQRHFLENKVIYSSYQDPLYPDSWWVATNTGLFFWQPKLAKPKKIRLGLSENNQGLYKVNIVYRDNNRLWIGGDELFGYLDENKQFHSYLKDISIDDTRSSVDVIEEIRPGVLWLGTAVNGVIEFHINTHKASSLEKLWGVSCQSVYFIQQTDKARIIGCSSSIIRQDKATHEVLVINDNDGLISNELNQGAYFFDSDKGLYVGTPNGAMLLDTDLLKNRVKQSSALIESINVHYDNRVQLSLLPEKANVIAAGAKLITFQLSRSDYLDDSLMVLKYRLIQDGARKNNDYLLLEGQPQLNILGLKAGDYVLEVLVQQNGIWASRPLLFSFTVEEFWWQSIWFTVFVLLILLGVCIIGFGLRRQHGLAFRSVNNALLESEDRLRQSLKGSDSELWEWKRETELFRLGNESGVLGVEDKLIYLKESEFPVHKKERSAVFGAWNEMLAGKRERFDCEYRYRRIDRSWGWMKVRGRPVEWNEVSGDITRVAGIFTDVTLQRKLEGDIKLLAQAFENTSEGVLILDNQEQIKVTNKAAKELIGAEESLIDWSFSELVLLYNGRFGTIAELLSQNLTWTGECELVRENKAPCPIWLNISAIMGDRDDITHFVAVFSDITERKRVEANLRQLANFDMLTGLPNRALFSNRLSKAIYRAHRKGEKLALLFLDLDRFKHINDSYGHSMGDALLVEAAKRLQACVPSDESLCRFGGDEFVLLLPNIIHIDVVNQLCQQLLTAIAAPFSLYGREFYISTSIGVSLWPEDASQAETLIKNADLAMYHAKEEGRGNIQYYSAERNEQALYHMGLETDLRKAIERDQFELYYQPQVDTQKGNKLIGMEALLRWKHPKEGFIQPDLFIKVAEGCGLIIDIDRWVLKQACLQRRQWDKDETKNVKLSINISGVHFLQSDFIDYIKEVLSDTQCAASGVTLEITEGVLMKELNIAKAHLSELRALGINVAIDDFGTGYSSLAYLRHFDVTSLKIDRSFLKDITANKADQAIVSSIIELAKNLNLDLIAEGVENKEQLQQVLSRGCYQIQGYYFSKPMPFDEMQAYIKRFALTA